MRGCWDKTIWGSRGCWVVATANTTTIWDKGLGICWYKPIWGTGLKRLLGRCDGELDNNLGQGLLRLLGQTNLEADGSNQFGARGSRGCWVVATAISTREKGFLEAAGTNQFGARAREAAGSLRRRTNSTRDKGL